MELTTKQGFKQTEVGLIPEDWRVRELDHVLKFGSGQDYKHLSKGEIPVYGTGGIMTYVNNHLYNGESVGIGRKGTIDKPVFLSGKFWTVDTLFYTKDFLDSIPKFIYYKFLIIPWKEYNEASGVPSLNKNTLGKIKIALPPTLKEQKAIATALSDVDNLITSLENLIAKKQAIKQGAMQQLLTPPHKGGKRLPGFSGDWEERTIESLVSNNGLVRGPFGGALKKDFFVKNGYKVYEQKNAIYKSIELGNYFIDNQKFKELKRFEIQENDFILSCSGTIGRIYQIPSGFQKGIINQALLIIRIDNLISDYNYFKHQFTSDSIQKNVIDDTQGGAMKNLIGMPDFKKATIPYPPTLKEQKAIAKILSDMDTELEQLETKKAKYQQLKQGMLQELLTGNTRLV
ncbi:restriction endonuclease subunit S [Tenacibaculum maritimum]|uniref:restriction endonuclease subunit S n=1 Tax=Tenacibaculum maritimum TaxID=107401 RepID=UPI00388E60CB